MFKTCYQGHLQLILAKDSKPAFRTKTASLWEKPFGKAYKNAAISTLRKTI